MSPKQLSCLVVQVTLYLLLANSAGAQLNTWVYWVDPDANKVQRATDAGGTADLVTTGLLDPQDIALDLVANKMYWTDSGTQKIQRANLDGSTVEDLVDNPTDGLVTPTGIAVDAGGGKIYWTDPGTGKIQRSNLDGSTVEDLLTGLSGANYLELDLTASKIYWTEDGSNKIRRANLDGTTPEDLVTTGLDVPSSIVLDTIADPKKIYWVDTGTGKLQRSNLDGTNVQDLITTDFSLPLGLAIDTAGVFIWWSESDDLSPNFGINRANLDGTGQVNLLNSTFTEPRGMALDLRSACCNGAVCSYVDRQTCYNGDGWWDPAATDCSGSPCANGACCTGPSGCDDGGGAMDLFTCDVLGGTYVGGALCGGIPPTCNTCSFLDEAHCKLPNGGFIIVSDRASGIRLADDFQAAKDGNINSICWWPAFYNPDLSMECGEPGLPPADDFIVRFYDDSGGVPGTELGPPGGQTVTVAAKVWLGFRVWRYSASLSTPIPVVEGGCYWLEITGSGEGPNGCQTYWSSSLKGNGFYLQDNDSNYGTEDVFIAGQDLAFCLDIGLNDANDCGGFPGTCCECGVGCVDTTHLACDPATEVFTYGDTCPGVELCQSTVPTNDQCSAATAVSNVPVTTNGSAELTLVDQANWCADTDGPVLSETGDCAASLSNGADLHNDIWYSYVAEATGELTVQSCNDADNDQMIAIYDGDAFCPLLTTDELACNDDGCTGQGNAGPSDVTVAVTAGQNILVRVGGWNREVVGGYNGNPRGTFTLHWSLALGPPCALGPEPSGVDKVRTVSFAPCSVGELTAIRVLTCVGNAWWVGVPDPVTGMASLESAPVYRDWSLDPPVIHVTDIEIIPNDSYSIQQIRDGDDTQDEGLYSAPLVVTTSLWGDVAGSFDGSNWTAPNGAVNLSDVVALINTFSDSPTSSLPVYRSDLLPPVPDSEIDLEDVLGPVLAFNVVSYADSGGYLPCVPCAVPADCPGFTDFCDGVESCIDGFCRPGTSPCPAGTSCNETADVCESATPLVTCALSSPSVAPGGTVEVTLSVQDVSQLKGYQTGLDIARTGGTGTLTNDCPGGVYVVTQTCTGNGAPCSAPFDPTCSGGVDGVCVTNPDLPFSSPTAFVNCSKGRAGNFQIAGTGGAGGTPVHMATHVVKATGAIAGSTFEITGADSQLRNDSNELIGFATGSPCVLTVLEADCNGNAIADADDIADCPLNFPNPEDCDDCNSNSIPDGCDIASEASADCNNNGIPDECEDLSIILVQAGASGANDGTSWGDAFADLQDGLYVAACSGSALEVWVAAGTYHPDDGLYVTENDRTATFQLMNGVEMYGGFAGSETVREDRNPALNETTLSGDLTDNDVPAEFPDGASQSENSYSVVTGSGTDATALLDGFTVSGGNAHDPCCGTIAPETVGGGLYNNPNGSPTVSNCTFTSNYATWGGGVGNWSSSTPIVSNCLFEGNAALLGGGMHDEDGSDSTVVNCVFRDNQALGDGGGMHNISSNPSVVGCTFDGNSASVEGGGALNGVGAGTGYLNCAFFGNTASVGGAVYNRDSNAPMFVNCTLSGNAADTDGGGMHNDNSASPILVNCSVGGNTAVGSGGGIYNGSSGTNSPQIDNCIFWNNSDVGGTDESAQIHTVSGTPTVNYSIVQGTWTGAGGTGTLSGDPMFVDPGGTDTIVGTEDDNLRLQLTSPAIDAGNDNAVPADSTDIDGDNNTLELLPFDLDQNRRFANDLLTADTGVGSPVVDMGAYEAFRDCNGNGIGDDLDLQPGGGSEDCDGNGNLDECDITECGGDPACGDCNSNGVPDGCDISSGTSSDCNGGGVPDECDIAACDPSMDPGCDDCNNNAVPDECDISTGTSLDVEPMGAPDGRPDECTAWDGAPDNRRGQEELAGLADNWSTATNWETDTVPGTSTAATIDGNAAGGGTLTVELDVPASIASFRILNGATLNVQGLGGTEDLTILTDKGMLVRGKVSTNSRSIIDIANDRLVDVSLGRLSIGAAGQIVSAGDTAPGTNSIFAASIGIRNGSCECPPADGGELSINGTSIETTGDLVLVPAIGAVCNTLCMAQRGGTTPPILTTIGSFATIGGDLIMNAREAAVARGGTTPPILTIESSTFEVLGDFTMNDRAAASPARGGTTPPILNMNLSSFIVHESFLMDGRGDDVGSATGLEFNATDSTMTIGGNLTVLGPGSTLLGRGGTTPPILNLINTTVTIDGDIVLDGAVDVRGLAARAAGPTISSLVLGGNFINRSLSPGTFDLENAWITMNGALPQTFEVGAVDRGAGTTDLSGNFRIGALTISEFSQVTLVDAFDNSEGGQTSPEVLYVGTLVLESNSFLAADNTVVYYDAIQGDGDLEPGAAIQRVPSVPGPCCLPNVTCVDVPAIDCALAGGVATGLACGIDPDGDGVPNGCDVCPGGDDTIDSNGNGVPDACDLQPAVFAAAPHNVLKNRYISIRALAQNPGLTVFDIKATLTSTLVNGVTTVGSDWWAGAPDAACISIMSPTRPASPPDWTGCDTIHLTGCGIIPTSTYDISIVDVATESAALLARTQALPAGSKWFGDVIGTFDPVADQWTAPNGIVAIDDAVAAIKTFQNPSLVGPGCGTPPCNATHVSVTDIHPAGFPLQPWGTPNQLVDINDVFAIILGFQGVEFPGPDLGSCP